jgi:hypothetical protein
MWNLKSAALVAVSALALTLAQPRPAEAGDAGKIIAGIAIGAIAAGILSHAARAHDGPYAYYAPERYDYDDDYGYGHGYGYGGPYRYAPPRYKPHPYYGRPYPYAQPYYYKKGKKHGELSPWQRAHPGAVRNVR